MGMYDLVRSLSKLVPPLLAGSLLLLAPGASRAEITLEGPLAVRLLWDNSGSMCPGYQAPGTAGRQKCSEMGVRFYHEYDEIRDWLGDFVALQTLFNGKTVEMKIFAEQLQTAHREVPLAEFDARRALSYDTPPGRLTYIADNLDRYSRGFEGLLWLITDNIVEERVGKPDEGVREFFEMVAKENRYRAVHLYKLPFRDPSNGKVGNLAIYGILVSDAPIDPSTLKYFDRKFREDFLEARRQSNGENLFPGKDYWKLKELGVGALALDLKRALEAMIDQPDVSLFRERQVVRLPLTGAIVSLLTQHDVVSGSYKLLIGSFKPKVLGRDDVDTFGLKEIGTGIFEGNGSSLSVPIPPGGRSPIFTEFRSREPIVIETKGFWAFWISAFSGLKVEYTGQVQAVFSDIVAEFDRDKMQGIFEAEEAPAIFNLDRPINISTDESEPIAVTFVLETSYHRYALGFLVIVLGLALLGFCGWFLSRKEQFRVKVGERETIVGLRRGLPGLHALTGSYDVTHEGHRLGQLVCTIKGDGQFTPDVNSAAVQVHPSSKSGRWDVTIRDQGSLLLTIEPMGRGHITSREEQGGRRRMGGGLPRPPRGPRIGGPPGPPPGGGGTPPKPPAASGSGAPEASSSRRPPIKPPGGARPRIKRPGS